MGPPSGTISVRKTDRAHLRCWESSARQLDALIVESVPNVRMAVRWNSPFYGVEGRGWFISYHCFDRYLKVTFLNGSSLDPLPPIDSKDPETRYANIYEDEAIDVAQFRRWLQQASSIPGWEGF